MLVIEIITQVDAGQHIVFVDGLASLRSATVHIIIYIHIHFIILHTHVGNEPFGKLVGSLCVCRMDFLIHGVLVYVLVEDKVVIIQMECL